MHVLQVISATGPGGIEQVAFDYAQALALEGIPVTTVAAMPEPQCRRYADQGLRLIDDRRVIKWWSVIHPSPRRRYRRLVVDEAVSAVVVHIGRALPLFQRAAGGLAPVITVAHTDNIRRRLRGDAVFCVNTRLAGSVEAAFQAQGIAGRPVFAIPNPISVPSGERACAGVIRARPVGDADGTLRVGGLCQFLPQKGLPVLLHALRRLVDDGVRVRAVLGGDGPDRAMLEALTDALGIRHAVRFPGWITDKRAFFDDIDLFCLPSLNEPFGLVVTEAMAYGRPVIVSDADGPRDIVTDGVNGLMTAKGDDAALAARIRELAADPARLTDLAVAGNAHALTAFSHAHIGRVLRRSLETVIAGYRAVGKGPVQQGPVGNRRS